MTDDDDLQPFDDGPDDGPDDSILDHFHGPDEDDDDGNGNPNEFVIACGVPGCLMPAAHMRSECHTVEDILAWEAALTVPAPPQGPHDKEIWMTEAESEKFWEQGLFALVAILHNSLDPMRVEVSAKRLGQIAEYLRTRVKNWKSSIPARSASYDNAVKALIEAALAEYDAD